MAPPAKTTVVNKNKGEPFDVYIGRGSPFGNPYSHTPSTHNTIQVATREDAVAFYEHWITTAHVVPGWVKPTPAMIAGLRGRRLGCWCHPRACHGNVLARLADAACEKEGSP